MTTAREIITEIDSLDVGLNALTALATILESTPVTNVTLNFGEAWAVLPDAITAEVAASIKSITSQQVVALTSQIAALEARITVTD